MVHNLTRQIRKVEKKIRKDKPEFKMCKVSLKLKFMEQNSC
jgi:hypothetical protein